MDPQAQNPGVPTDVPVGDQAGVTTPVTTVPPVTTPVTEPMPTPTTTPEPIGEEQPAAPAETGTGEEQTPPATTPAA